MFPREYPTTRIESSLAAVTVPTRFISEEAPAPDCTIRGAETVSGPSGFLHPEGKNWERNRSLALATTSTRVQRGREEQAEKKKKKTKGEVGVGLENLVKSVGKRERKREWRWNLASWGQFVHNVNCRNYYDIIIHPNCTANRHAKCLIASSAAERQRTRGTGAAPPRGGRERCMQLN